MFKKVFGFLTVALVVLFVLSAPRVGLSGAMPESGDAVYRDMDMKSSAIKLVGHAGLFIGNFEVIHMQYPCIEKTNLTTNFYAGYWGSFYAGNYDVAKKRTKEVKELFSKKAKYSFTNYKSFGDKKPRGRCDGLVEWCFEKFGNDVVNDYHWSSLTPQMQWQSGAITKRYSSTRGKEAYSAELIDIGTWLENML